MPDACPDQVCCFRALSGWLLSWFRVGKMLAGRCQSRSMIMLIDGKCAHHPLAYQCAHTNATPHFQKQAPRTCTQRTLVCSNRFASAAAPPKMPPLTCSAADAAGGPVALATPRRDNEVDVALLHFLLQFLLSRQVSSGCSCCPLDEAIFAFGCHCRCL